MTGADRRVTYAEYLRLHEMLSLQDGNLLGKREISLDEHHFIVVHQAFELWFSRVIQELRSVRDLLDKEAVPEDDIPRAVDMLDRVTEIFRLLQGQWKVMQTLTPQGFLAFRDELGTSSGFESFQMRELELLIGLDITDRPGGMDPLAHFERLAGEGESGQRVYDRLLATSKEASLKDVLTRWLYRTPIHGSTPTDANDEEVVRDYVEEHLNTMSNLHEEALQRFAAVGQGDPATLKGRFDASLQGARDFLLPEGEIDRSRAGLLFIESYRELPLLAWPRSLVDAAVALEQAMLLFRSHHARMVERMIGRRVGTGGSAGVDYLDATTKMRVFTDLWAIRTLLLKRVSLPELVDESYYGFSS